ncbi:unnamed protein product [Meganyctiphanes norvegica]|uniref:Uncharacterized protein n=1 Tax=Meganyctiphanes norvegica TaxID=48144 RepID=A0AAV2R3P9_MEGNR
MAGTDYAIKYFLKEIPIVDNEEKLRALCLKMRQITQEVLFNFTHEYVKLMFSTRDCDDIVMNQDRLMIAEKYSDPYIRLGVMCFISIFCEDYDNRYDLFLRENFLIKITQIVVDTYIPCVEGSLFNAHILIDLIHMMRANYPFSSMDHRNQSALQSAARMLYMNQSDFQDGFYANLIDLLPQLIFIEIKCINFTNMSDALLVSIDLVKFFDIYFEISEYILENYPKSRSLILIDHPGMSAIAVITNCIFLFQAKLLASDINSSYWSNMICKMEKLRDQMAIFSLPPSSGTSLQMFLIDRADGNFNTNCTEKLYNVTNDVNQINVSGRNSDITVRPSLYKIKLALCSLMQYVNNICHVFNAKHRVIKKLYSVSEHFISISMHVEQNMNVLFSSDESLVSSESESSNSLTRGEACYGNSDDEISTNGNDDSESGTD